MWDADKFFSDDYMGSACIDLRRVVQEVINGGESQRVYFSWPLLTLVIVECRRCCVQKSVSETVTLENKKKHKEEVTGTITVEMQFAPMDAHDNSEKVLPDP